jgi:hypothetical protein
MLSFVTLYNYSFRPSPTVLFIKTSMLGSFGNARPDGSADYLMFQPDNHIDTPPAPLLLAALWITHYIYNERPESCTFKPVFVSKTTAICLLIFCLSLLLQLAFKVPCCFLQNYSNEQKFLGTRLCSIRKSNSFFIID